MSGALFKVVIFLIVAGAIFFGARRIWRDWKGQFKKLDEVDRQRDLRERQRPDVITLKRGADGTFRPGDDKP